MFQFTAKGAQGTILFQQMVEDMPINVLTCNLKDFTIDYANKASIETLKQLEHLLPCRADDLVGQCIDIFDENPPHQRQLLSDPKNLPHKAIIEIGGESLDLLFSAIHDSGGNYVAPMLTWSVVADKVKAGVETAQLMRMLDTMPINVMLMESKNFTITYVNQTSKDTLDPLQSLLPCPVNDMIGQCVDIFYKDPSHQLAFLGDPKNLPHTVKFKFGDETLSLNVSAVLDKDGNYASAVLTWAVITQQVKMADDFEASVGGVVESVSSSATEMQSTAKSMAATAEETNTQASTVAAASEELTSSINEISQQVTRSASIAATAVEEAERSNEMVKGLATTAQKIGEVVSLINDIADQTNLLALNATIEAARAGDAGKGFAVVASEVKNLANQTAKATEDIANQVTAIQGATEGTVAAIEGIGKVIAEISEITTAISSAVEEQGAATQEVTGNITGVTTASSETGQAANQVLEAAGELAKQSDILGQEVRQFLEDVRAQ